MTSYLEIEWRYSFAPVESGGKAKNWRYMQNFSFIAPWLQRAVFQYLLNLLCACVQRSASIFRADKSFSWFGFQSWPNLPNFEVICVENTQLCSRNLFLHINEETLARCCSHYDDFRYRHKCLVDRLLSQGYKALRLEKSFKKFYGRYQDLIEKYRRSVNAMVSDSFPGQFLFNM